MTDSSAWSLQGCVPSADGVPLIPIANGAQAARRMVPVVRPWRKAFRVAPLMSLPYWVSGPTALGGRDTVLLIDMASASEGALDAVRPALSDVDTAPVVVAVGGTAEDALRAFDIGAIDIVDPRDPQRRFYTTVDRVLVRLNDQRAERASRCTVRVGIGKVFFGAIGVEVEALNVLQQVGRDLVIRVPTGEIRVHGHVSAHPDLERIGLVWINDTTVVATSSVSDVRTGPGGLGVTAVRVDSSHEWMPVAPTRSVAVRQALQLGRSPAEMVY